jgi:Tol biopolymer transport system component
VDKTGIRPNRDIFVMDSNGAHQTNLTRNAAACVSEFPAWSPDGTEIAFDSNCEGAWFQVYVMQADGSHFRRMTNSEGHDRHPTWSPDNRQIAFDSNRNLADPGRRLLKDESEVYILSLDSGIETQVTSCGPKFSGRPVWTWAKASPQPDY